ncbi:MAG: DUF433 domain-containing protein [Agriterribacter sp.]
MQDYSDIIVSEPGKRSGRPCIRNTRITVLEVLSYLAAGMTIEDILADSLQLICGDILACLAYAADIKKDG